jgi:REP element-mobilizing transposase RayT
MSAEINGATTRRLAMQLKYRGRGEPREGAGRPRKPGGRVSHDRRPALSRHHPVHVTLRVAKSVPNLRRIQAFRQIADAFHEGRDRFGFRVVHCSVQGNHIHLIAEAENRVSLSRGMKGLEVRIARGVNEATGRSGALFAERYHARVLRNPREVRNASTTCSRTGSGTPGVKWGRPISIGSLPRLTGPSSSGR